MADQHGQKTALPAITPATTLEYREIIDGVIQDVQSVAKRRADGVRADTSMIDIGLDSLEWMDVISRIESRFRVRLPETLIDEIETSRELADAVSGLLARKPNETASQAVPEEDYIFEKSPEYLRLQAEFSKIEAAGEENPFFCEHAGISNHQTRIDGRTYINFSGNNYLGMSGDPVVTAASVAAVEAFGTSVSASRIVSGTRPIHRELESAICDFLGVPECITFTAGHTTNAVVLGHLFGPDDLILHDELVHNSIVFGCKVSGAERRSFPHNDWEAASDYLREMRDQYRKVVVVIEGLYSMDGDYPDLTRFVEVKDRHHAWLYVDEAHSIGTMGATGRGLAEMFGVPRDAVEIWMGTLSKALGACGGFVAARESIIRYLKYTCPGVVFTIGLSPASCGAATAAIRLIKDDNRRIRQLHENAAYFLEQARGAGFNTGDSAGSPIVPVILGDSLRSLRASRQMHEEGVSVQPIMYPAVPNELARLRFFVNSRHTREQLDQTVAALQKVLPN